MNARLGTFIIVTLITLCFWPTKETYAQPTPAHKDVLRLDAIGTGSTYTAAFNVPVKAAWGLAWRYRCAGHAAEYDMELADLENAVDLVYTLISEHGTHGAGYRMETGETSNITQPNGKQAGIVLALHVKTTCRWHIRVVAGSMQVVRRWVPRLVNRSSWSP